MKGPGLSAFLELENVHWYKLEKTQRHIFIGYTSSINKTISMYSLCNYFPITFCEVIGPFGQALMETYAWWVFPPPFQFGFVSAKYYMKYIMGLKAIWIVPLYGQKCWGHHLKSVLECIVVQLWNSLTCWCTAKRPCGQNIHLSL